MSPFSPREASSRSAGLLRIGFALLLWTRFGSEMTLWSGTAPERVLVDLAFWLSTTLLLVGYRSRLASAATAATCLYMFYALGVFGGRDEWNSHHVWVLLSTASLLVLTPCGNSYSIDRWLSLRRGTPLPERGWTGGVNLMALQLSAVYFWSAVDKSNWGFLSGQRLQAIFLNLYLENVPSGAWADALIAAVAVSVVAFEYFISVGIHVRRTHWWLLPAGLVLHALFFVLIPVSVFSVNVALLYLTVIDPDAVHAFLDRLQDAADPPTG